MQLPKYLQLVGASFAALALAYCVLNSLPLYDPDLGSPSTPSLGDVEGAPTDNSVTGIAEAPLSTRSFATSSPQVPPTGPSPEWSSLFDTASEEPRRALGEPLNASNAEAGAPVAPEVEPIDIGPALDVQDPLLVQPNTLAKRRGDIGDPLNADEPWRTPTAGEDPISIGPELDADDHGSWEQGHSAFPAAEIGVALDAGTPRNR